MIIQFCGLSGAGKSTLTKTIQAYLKKHGLEVEIIDGDEYRETLCKGLGFTREDRVENIRRMAFVADKLSKYNIISIISAINPYEEVRREIAMTYKNAKLIHIDCSLQTLQKRDTKGLYKRALLPDSNPEKLFNLTGISDPFETPVQPDVYINTGEFSICDCTERVASFILKHYAQNIVPRRKFSFS